MPTVYVKTTLDYTLVDEYWSKRSDAEKANWAEFAPRPDAQRVKFSILERQERQGGTMMLLKQQHFQPYDAFQIDFDAEKGALHVQFDGYIKLPIDSSDEARLKAWPKGTPMFIWIEEAPDFLDQVITFEAKRFPCTISKSKPKDVSF
jgi:hypothetical protein